MGGVDESALLMFERDIWDRLTLARQRRVEAEGDESIAQARTDAIRYAVRMARAGSADDRARVEALMQADKEYLEADVRDSSGNVPIGALPRFKAASDRLEAAWSALTSGICMEDGDGR